MRLSGKDPLEMLNAILTNNIPREADRGAYALLLNPKGRVQTDLRVLKSAGVVFIDTEPEGADAAREILGRYAPFSRVKLEELSGDWSTLGLYGSRAGTVLGGVELAEHQTAEVEVGNHAFLVAGVAAPVAGYDLFGPRDALDRVREHLAARGAVRSNLDSYETARVAAGIPRFGTDITPENFPGEAGILDRAVDFAKGCYPGQETVARMRYRGHPNKRLYRFSTDAADLAPNATVVQDASPVGTITSVAPLRADGETFALGYLSRKADPEAPLTADDHELRVLGEAG